MKPLRLILLCVGLFMQIPHLQAQLRLTDELRHLIANTSDEKVKLTFIHKLFNLGLNPDTLYPYLSQAESITLHSKDRLERDKVSMLRANYYLRKNYVDSALRIMEPLMPVYQKDASQQSVYLNLLFFKSKALDRANRYTQALTQLYIVEEKAAALKDTLIQIQAATGIGWVQMEMEQYNEALSWLYKALYFTSDKKFYKNYGALYSNIASVYNAIGKADSAKTYIDIAIKDARENENSLFLATALSMQAKIFINSKQPALAEAPLHEVVEIRKLLNDPFYTVYDMSSLASYYANNGQADKGIRLCQEGIVIAKKSGLSSQLLMIYRALAENYKAASNIPAYSNTLEDVITLKDSFNNINSAKLLADMKAKSDALEKEKTITEQKLKLTVQNYWLFGAVLFSIMAGIITWLGFKYYHRKQNVKMQLALAEEKRIAAQSIIDAEEQERKRIAADLHDNIGAYASAICADVEKLTLNGNGRSEVYLQNLQQHSQEIMTSLRDTIWILHKENITITGISDRIKNYLFKLRPSYEQIQFSIEEEISNDVRLSSRDAFNIFRIVQEALHNALKHSGASMINLSVASNEQLVIKVTDNGKGVDLEHAPTGNGLLNMQTRAKETGVKVRINSSAQKGTEVVLSNGTTN